MLIDHPKGGYQFVLGGGPYSSGARALPGFEIVHAIFHPLPSLEDSYGIIERRLAKAGRPIEALCGMELRMPEALSIEGFIAFNQPYIDRLKAWGTHVDGMNPVARTNVAPVGRTVSEASVYGFCYTIPSDCEQPTFVVAGGGELEGDALVAEQIVARGDLSQAGLEAKMRRVIGHMSERLAAMNLSWDHATQSNVYTVHDIQPLMESTLLPPLGDSALHGVRWHYSRPPVLEIEYEMDVRGVRQEITVGA